MVTLPTVRIVDPVPLVRLLDERFRSLGVTSPDGRLFVNLAWLYHHAGNYLEILRRATQDMADEDGLTDILAELESNLSSLVLYAKEAQPEIHEIFEEH